ncbi:hypothetical protein [Pantoea alhagi]|uniref:hypothetical protein n=1 Tax=Pantoea alhagi TaxID=1891675 RepID=UPI0030B8E544
MKKALKIGFIGGGLNSAIGLTHSIACQMDGHFKLVAGCFSRDEAQKPPDRTRMGGGTGTNLCPANRFSGTGKRSA